MSGFTSLYLFIERTFFGTLSRKIIGNIGFLAIFFLLALYLAYPEGGASGRTGKWLTAALSPTQYWYLPADGGLTTPAMWPEPASRNSTGPVKWRVMRHTLSAGAM